MRTVPSIAAAWALFASAPAGAYVLPGRGVILHAGQQADDAHVETLLATGTALLRGESARAAGQALGVGSDDELATRATLAMRSPGRCRLTLSPVAGGREASATFSGGKLQGELAVVPALAAYLRGACELTAVRSSGSDEAQAQVARALRIDAVDAAQVQLRRLDDVVVYALGRDRAQAWFDQQDFRPVRVLFLDAGIPWDVRLLQRGQPPVGDLTARVLEVRRQGMDAPELRIAFEHAEKNGPLAGL